MLKKDQMRRWLIERLQTQKRLVTAAAITLWVIGGIATLVEFVLFFVIVRFGFIKSGIPAALVTLIILGVIQYFTSLRLKKQLPDVEHEHVTDGTVQQIKVAPTMSAVWTYAFGSLESDRSWVEMLLGVLSMPQRMIAAATYAWQRKKEIELVEIAPCAAILRMLAKEAERVNVIKISEEIELPDLPRTLREVSLIDGVIFLTRQSLGLSLATRLVDDLVEWKQKNAASENRTPDAG